MVECRRRARPGPKPADQRTGAARGQKSGRFITSFLLGAMLHAANGSLVASGLKAMVSGGSKSIRALFWVGISALVIAVVAAATFEILLSRAEPILRARLLQSLSARFHSRVELGAFDVSLLARVRGLGQRPGHLSLQHRIHHADLLGAAIRLPHRLLPAFCILPCTSVTLRSRGCASTCRPKASAKSYPS